MSHAAAVEWRWDSGTAALHSVSGLALKGEELPRINKLVDLGEAFPEK